MHTLQCVIIPALWEAEHNEVWRCWCYGCSHHGWVFSLRRFQLERDLFQTVRCIIRQPLEFEHVLERKHLRVVPIFTHSHAYWTDWPLRKSQPWVLQVHWLPDISYPWQEIFRDMLHGVVFVRVHIRLAGLSHGFKVSRRSWIFNPEHRHIIEVHQGLIDGRIYCDILSLLRVFTHNWVDFLDEFFVIWDLLGLFIGLLLRLGGGSRRYLNGSTPGVGGRVDLLLGSLTQSLLWLGDVGRFSWHCEWKRK